MIVCMRPWRCFSGYFLQSPLKVAQFQLHEVRAGIIILWIAVKLLERVMRKRSKSASATSCDQDHRDCRRHNVSEQYPHCKRGVSGHFPPLLDLGARHYEVPVYKTKNFAGRRNFFNSATFFIFFVVSFSIAAAMNWSHCLKQEAIHDTRYRRDRVCWRASNPAPAEGWTTSKGSCKASRQGAGTCRLGRRGGSRRYRG
jgi:hypothetical protein